VVAATEGPMKEALEGRVKAPPIRKLFQVWESPNG
jgi:hypothetical protein